MSASSSKKRVRAAGGLVVDDDGNVLVVHRPRYDDWSFPKGKIDPGETLEQCALREVAEETGFVCELGEQLTVSRYIDHKGRRKDVHYWWMTPRKGKFKVNDEVDEIRWVSPSEASKLLTYGHDLDVLRDALN